MRRLIPGLSFREALDFGWRALAAVLAENVWLYIAVLALGVGLTTWFASSGHFQTIAVEGIAGIAALGAGARYAVPSFKMTFRSVLGAVAINLIGSAVVILAIAAPIAFAAATRMYAELIVLVALFPLAVWVAVKLLCAPAFYVLRSGEGSTIIGALKESWFFVSDDNWPRVFGVATSIALIGVLLPALACGAIYGALFGSNATLAAVLASTIYYLGSIPSSVWTQTSMIALASTEGGTAEE